MEPTLRPRREARREWLALLVVLALGIVLFSPALGTPLFLDDHVHKAMVEGTFPSPRSPFDLYSYADDTDRAALMTGGYLPWWSEPGLKIRFLRPLASALLWLDHSVFQHGSLPMHVHSFAWWAAAVLATRRLYARFFSPRVVLIATAIFALSPCHALPLVWIANREALVSLTFGALALTHQASFREQQKRGTDALLSTCFFALALLGGGEYATCFGGYVLAIEIAQRGERQSMLRRAFRLMTFVLPTAGYLLVRASLGYGTAGSGFYSDPFGDPRAFLLTAPSRFVSLLATGWLTFEFDQWKVGLWRALLVAVVVALTAALIVPLRRAFASIDEGPRRAAMWLLVGSILALVPVLAVVPARRLLGASMIGVSVAVAILLDHVWFRAEGYVARSPGAALGSLAALGLGFAHLVHGPTTSWLAARLYRRVAVDFDARSTWLSKNVGNTAETRLGVVRGMGAMFFAPFALHPRGLMPRQWFVLSQADHVLVGRRDERTIVVTAATGRGLYPLGEANIYRSANAPMRVGDRIDVPGMRVTILEVGEAGPRTAEFVFDENPNALFWVNEGEREPTKITLPDPGFGHPFDP